MMKITGTRFLKLAMALTLLFVNVTAGTILAAQEQPPDIQSPSIDPPKITVSHQEINTPSLSSLSTKTAPTTEWTFHKTSDNVHPDGQEQKAMWLMNRARSNPTQEGIWLATSTDPHVAGGRDYFGVDLTLLQSEFASYDPKPPAAFDVRLYNAAKAHSEDLIARDAQDHTGQFARISAAGFSYDDARGSVFAYAKSGLNAHAAWNIDWGPDDPDDGDGMQASRGHRKATMSLDGDYTNVGIAAIYEDDSGTNVGPYVTTGNYCQAANATDHYNRFIVGTVWEDTNSNTMYDPGEGIGGVTVMPDSGTYYAVTGNNGGYAIPVDAGTYTVTYSGAVNAVKTVTVGNDSALLDLLYTGLAAPNAPGNLNVTLTSQTAITLTWTDNSDDEDGFEIERSPDGSDNWLQVGTVMTDVTTHTDTGLTCETPYYYRARAFNMGGNSEYSNVVSDTTAACPAAPALTVVKSVDTGGLDPVPLGGVVTYTIVIRNNGMAIASNVVITDPLPEAVDNVEWLNQGAATLVTHTIRWGPHDISVDETYTFTFRTTVRDETLYKGKNIVNTAYASAENVLPTSSSASFTIHGDTFYIYLPLVLHGWPPTYSVSGNITDDQSGALAGVMVADDAGHTTKSDANGDYTLSGLYAGSYTLTPSKDGYTFAPVTTTVSVPPEATGVNFVGTPTASPLQRLIVFEAFLRPTCGFCQAAAQVIRDQLVSEYANKAVLFLEYDLDASDPRLARWWDGYQIGGYVTLPLVMTDSGDQVATGDVYSSEGFYAAFTAMIDAALVIPEGQAEVSATAQRSGNRVAASVQVTNRGAITLGTGNKATVWLVVYEEFDDAPVTDRLTRRYVRATASQAIATDLAPDASAAFNLETADLSGVNWDRLRAVVVVDYRPNPAARPYETYQAISVPVTP